MSLFDDRRPLLLDGGLATTLEARGASLTSELWSAELLRSDPALITAVHREFVDAGSSLIKTAGYQFHFAGALSLGIGREEAEKLLRTSVRLARQAGAQKVAASFGPYGAALGGGCEYTGDYGVIDPGVLRAFHEERLTVLADCDADCFAFETFPRLDEALTVIDLMNNLEQYPYWIAFQLRSASELADGTSLVEAVRVLQESGAPAAVGINCVPPACATAALELIKGACHLPVVVYANSGESYRDGSWHGDAAQDFVAEALRWRELGAAAIGGCCRVGPSEIARLAGLL